jgi:glycosyltransferase involved in cell wall biosynthesis
MGALSVIVITWNEEKNIRRCLESVRWADEIILVDSFSTDRTQELARSFTRKIFQHEFDGDIPQRQRGFREASGEWLLYLDADEEVSEELGAQIRGVIGTPGGADGYYLSRRSKIFGKWIQHGGWSPDLTFRLFRRGKVIPEPAEVHGGFTVGGEKGTLSGTLYHYTYDSIQEYLAKMNDYTSLQVSSKLPGPDRAGHAAWKILLSPLSHFFRKYVSTRGYRDGVRGLFLAALGAVYTLALYAKVWEYRMRARQEGQEELPPVTNAELHRLKRLEA